MGGGNGLAPVTGGSESRQRRRSRWRRKKKGGVHGSGSRAGEMGKFVGFIFGLALFSFFYLLDLFLILGLLFFFLLCFLFDHVVAWLSIFIAKPLV